MSNPLFTAATGMNAQMVRMGVIANNIANMNTSGFKASRAEFQDLVYQIMRSPGGNTSSSIQSPGGLQVGTGVKVVSTPGLFTQGNLEQTGRDLDVAIDGKGFLGVTLPSGEVGYTRAGSLAINANGELVNQDGYAVSGGVTPTLTNVDRAIGIDGTVTSRNPTTGAVTNEGQLQLFTFANEAALSPLGRNLYAANDASGAATQGLPGDSGFGNINQGFLESANVNIAEELIRMILAQRAYELNSKVIQTSDQMLAATNQLR